MTAWHALEGTAVCYTVALSAAAAEAAVQLNTIDVRATAGADAELDVLSAALDSAVAGQGSAVSSSARQVWGRPA